MAREYLLLEYSYNNANPQIWWAYEDGTHPKTGHKIYRNRNGGHMTESDYLTIKERRMADEFPPPASEIKEEEYPVGSFLYFKRECHAFAASLREPSRTCPTKTGNRSWMPTSRPPSSWCAQLLPG